MKIIYKKGDALAGPEFYFMHGCNNQGVMGSGIAKQVKEQFKEAYDFYRWNYTRQGLVLGKTYLYETNGKCIINAITQSSYGKTGQHVGYDSVRECIEDVNNYIEEGTPVAMPKIGAGLGGGSWKILEGIFETHSKFQPVVYEL